MLDLLFTATLLGLLPLAVARPFVGVLLWSWISFMNPHQELWGFAREVPWAAAVFGATLLGRLMAGEPRRPALNWVTALLLTLLVCFTITSVTALAPAPMVWDKWLFVSKVIIGLFLTAFMLTDRWRIHALIWMMVLSLGYFGVKGGLFTILTGGSLRVWGPPLSMISDNNHLAAALLVTLPLMNYLRLHSRHALVRWGLVAGMVLTLFAALGSQSRGALIGLAAASAVLWLRSRHKLASALVLAICVGGAINFMPDSWVARMNTIQTYQADGSASTRLELWGISLKLALDRPLLGSGFRGPYSQEVVDRVAPGGPARAVHSIWFELLGEHGFPTFVVWFGLTLAGLYYSVRLIRLSRDQPNLAWAGDLGRMSQVSIVAYLVSGSFLSLSYWDFYWTLLVVLGAAHGVAVRTLHAAERPSAITDGWSRPVSVQMPRPAVLAHRGTVHP